MRHDPGDAVPPGVAPKEPVPLTEEDREVKRRLEQLGADASPKFPGKDYAQGRAETLGPEEREG